MHTPVLLYKSGVQGDKLFMIMFFLMKLTPVQVLEDDDECHYTAIRLSPYIILQLDLPRTVYCN